MVSIRSEGRWLWVSVPAIVALAALVLVVRGPRAAPVDFEPAYEMEALPPGLDAASRLEDVSARLRGCEGACTEVVYIWTPRMPLSRSAIPNVVDAAKELGAGLSVVRFEELERVAETPAAQGSKVVQLAQQLLAAGALAHAPSLVVYNGADAAGTAILGYKSTAAYASLIARRLAGEHSEQLASSALSLPDEQATPVTAYTDYAAIGVPGAYFKWVPGRRTLAYESGQRVYLLDLEDGENRVGPGYIDFVPTPDGRYFVTPSPRNGGLAFFDADEAFEGSRQGRAGDVRAVFVDRDMRDQYPSVGILDRSEASIRYRVLTSWFEGLVYRDYEVVHATDEASATVRPVSVPVVPCRGMGLSTPIMSQDGSEVAARDEATGTTKLFRLLDGDACEEVLDLGMPTRKVAWHSSGRKLAFSTPRVRVPTGDGPEPGIFVYDRDSGEASRVAGSEGASQLAFPDFVRDDAVVFMIPGRNGQSRFRVVEPLP